MKEILVAFAALAITGGLLGVILVTASRFFSVKNDERVDKIKAHLPGANCGGCGFAGCEQYANAIVKGSASPSQCTAADADSVKKIAEIMGVAEVSVKKKYAKVMCSGNTCSAKPKYAYEGISDCRAVSRMGGGTKVCPNGCVGLGTCVNVCKFDAISVVDGVAVIDGDKCTGCGKCSEACPKQIIKMIDEEQSYFVGCMSVDNGKTTASYCSVGCISCRLCEKACPTGAISVNDFVAAIDAEKCTGCGACAEKCKRGIIRPARKKAD